MTHWVVVERVEVSEAVEIQKSFPLVSLGPASC